eukprot:555835-Prorocentrum_minimum.AAC.1
MLPYVGVQPAHKPDRSDAQAEVPGHYHPGRGAALPATLRVLQGRYERLGPGGEPLPSRPPLDPL